MRHEQTHVFGVPLRTRKFRRQVRIGAVTHAYNLYGWTKATTRCGIPYTHKRSLANGAKMLATRTSCAVDCMACLVDEARR